MKCRRRCPRRHRRPWPADRRIHPPNLNHQILLHKYELIDGEIDVVDVVDVFQ